MPRNKLPDRRPNETVKTSFDGHTFFITIGYELDGTPREVFASGAKEGTAMQHILADACILLSIAMQYNIPLEELNKSIGQVPDPAHGEDAVKPASVVGAILALLLEDKEAVGAWDSDET